MGESVRLSGVRTTDFEEVSEGGVPETCTGSESGDEGEDPKTVAKSGS